MPPLIRQLSNARSRYFLTSSGINLEYRQKGDPFAETIVMLHGAASDCRIFLPNIDPLAESYQVIATSLRGHGLSDKPRGLEPEAFSMDILVRDLIELTWSLGIQAFHLVGHGLGAVIGYELMARDPGSLLSITSMAAPVGKDGLKGSVKLIQKATGLSTRILGNHKKQAEAAARMCSNQQEVIAFLRDEVFYGTEWNVVKHLRPHHSGTDHLDLIQEHTEIPILFLMGHQAQIEKSMGGYRAMQQSLVNLKDCDHVHTASVDQAGYFPNLDQPAEFHQILSHFLRSLK